MSSIKITLVSQAKSISLYNNLRTKVKKCCTNNYFNRQRLSNEDGLRRDRNMQPCLDADDCIYCCVLTE